MRTNKKLQSAALASAVLILCLIFVSSAASATTEQGASSEGTYAYITNGDAVSVIDTATNTITASVPIEGGGASGNAVSPDGTKIWVANYYSDTVSVIDAATNTVTATMSVGSYPWGVAVNPDGTKVYVGNFDYNGTVSVIDAATNTVTATVTVGSYPRGIAVNQDGAKVYVANGGSNTVSVIDAETTTVIATVNVGRGPSGVAVSPDGKKVYVANSDYNGTVSVIDTATDTVTATMPAGRWTFGIAVSPDGTKVYVTNSDYSGNLSVIDAATNTVTATVPVGCTPWGVAVTPDGKKVYVVNQWDGTISVIDAATNTVIATAPAGNYPSAFGLFIGHISPAPFAKFSAKPTEGKAPLTVAFTDTSTGDPTKWKWDFGDGTISTKQNPTHKYSKVGSYTVKLTATNDKGSNTATKTGYINVVTKPVAGFSASPTSGKAPLTVAFTDQSSGSPTKWKWSFGDGTISREQNPEHQYSQEGKYKITLTVSNATGSSTVKKINYIKVTTNTRPGIYSENK